MGWKSFAPWLKNGILLSLISIISSVIVYIINSLKLDSEGLFEIIEMILAIPGLIFFLLPITFIFMLLTFIFGAPSIFFEESMFPYNFPNPTIAGWIVSIILVYFFWFLVGSFFGWLLERLKNKVRKTV